MDPLWNDLPWQLKIDLKMSQNRKTTQSKIFITFDWLEVGPYKFSLKSECEQKFSTHVEGPPFGFLWNVLLTVGVRSVLQSRILFPMMFCLPSQTFLKRKTQTEFWHRRLQNLNFENLKICFRAFWRLNCIKIRPKWTLNSISTLQTLRKRLKYTF